MNREVSADLVLALKSGFRLQWEQAQDAYVLLYPEGMVELNPSASEILLFCDGHNTVAEMTAKLQETFPDVTNIGEDINEFLQVAIANGWLESK